jgi:hypothetical protein
VTYRPNYFSPITEELKFTVFGETGRINALANCLNAEFNPQPERSSDEENPADDSHDSVDIGKLYFDHFCKG